MSHLDKYGSAKFRRQSAASCVPFSMCPVRAERVIAAAATTTGIAYA
ncbi:MULTISPECIES: hypothetical protein [unclassified Burkholderia]|nr:MULTISPECIES: hypothetical protein [unclassified Burkholderia]